MALIEDHNVVSTFAADRPDHLLDVAFCHGKRGAVTTSVIPIAATRLLKAEPYETSRSRSRKLGDQIWKTFIEIALEIADGFQAHGRL
jgi:hypothetical protein